MSIITNIRKRGLKDILNPKRWILYIRGLRRGSSGTTLQISKTDSLTISNEELQSFIEQVIYRQSFTECKRCLKEGACTHCGCKSPELFYDKEMVCSGGNWNEMLPPKDWNEFKSDNGIEITSKKR